MDQTIEKVSFCAPDRNHDRGFSYICRDGTTRRWMCHGFLAIKDSGERLSHAVGCSFAVCLERKQRRDKECGVTMTFNMNNSTFTRTGSFRSQPITEMADINTAIVTPQPKRDNPFAIERPRASVQLLERQGSFRGFQQIGSVSPFKRQMSLRINDLPSNATRQKAFMDLHTPEGSQMLNIKEKLNFLKDESVSTLCEELSMGLTLLSNSKTFNELAIEEPIQPIQPLNKTLVVSEITKAPIPINNRALELYKPTTITTTATAVTTSATTTLAVVPAVAAAPSVVPPLIASVAPSMVPSVVPSITASVLPAAVTKDIQPNLSSTKEVNLQSIDPFNAEWVAPLKKDGASKNPFLSSI